MLNLIGLLNNHLALGMRKSLPSTNSSYHNTNNFTLLVAVVVKWYIQVDSLLHILVILQYHESITYFVCWYEWTFFTWKSLGIRQWYEKNDQ